MKTKARKASKKQQNDKFGKHLTIVLKKMCWLANVDFDKVNFNDSEWYSKHTWDVPQEYCFILWLNGYMYKNAEARKELMEFPFRNKKHIKRFVDFFNMCYGFRINYDK